MQMREIIDRWTIFLEASVPGQRTFWFNPQTKAIIPAHDHGEAVARDPDAFDISYDIADEVEAAMPYGYEDDVAEEDEDGNPKPLDSTNLPPLPEEIWGGRDGGWARDDIWEILAMNRGWVRCAMLKGISKSYISAANEALCAATVRAFRDDIGEAIEIEVVREHNQIFDTLNGDQIDLFARATTKNAAVILHKLTN